MNIQKLSAALMVTGLLIAVGPSGMVPAVAQSTVAAKQKTQDGADSAFGHYDDPKYGHYDDPKFKQRTQSVTHVEPTASK